MSTVSEYGLGRLQAEDERDERFPMSAIMDPDMPTRTHRYWWSSGWHGDQGNTPHCVAYSWLHWLADGPATSRTLTGRAAPPQPYDNPRRLYCEMQENDEWIGDCKNHRYDGTSVRAGAKVLRAHGYVREFRWGWTLDDAVKALLTEGPIVAGTWWYRDMYFPDPDTGLIQIGRSRRMGGHAYVLNGVNAKRGIIRLKNSWGRSWGRNGHAFISFKDMERLILEDGEVCLALETRPAR
jgi:hypothetical protein